VSSPSVEVRSLASPVFDDTPQSPTYGETDHTISFPLPSSFFSSLDQFVSSNWSLLELKALFFYQLDSTFLSQSQIDNLCEFLDSESFLLLPVEFRAMYESGVFEDDSEYFDYRLRTFGPSRLKLD
jgi:hypothetical protein